jgi:hypothetical protein
MFTTESQRFNYSSYLGPSLRNHVPGPGHYSVNTPGRCRSRGANCASKGTLVTDQSHKEISKITIEIRKIYSKINSMEKNLSTNFKRTLLDRRNVDMRKQSTVVERGESILLVKCYLSRNPDPIWSIFIL